MWTERILHRSHGRQKNPSLKLVKNLISRWSVKMKRRVFVRLKRKKYFQKHFHRKSSSKKPFRYLKKKDVSQYWKKKSNRCFVCKKHGHFARNCPHKSAKAVHLIQHLQHSSMLSENEDVESNFCRIVSSRWPNCFPYSRILWFWRYFHHLYSLNCQPCFHHS